MGSVNINRFAVKSANAIPASFIKDGNQKSSLSSSNGHQFTYNSAGNSSIPRGINPIEAADSTTHSTTHTQHQLVSPSSKLDTNTSLISHMLAQMNDIGLWKVRGEEIEIHLALGSSQEKLEEAQQSQSFCRFEGNTQEMEVSGNSKFCEMAKSTKETGKSFVFVYPDGSRITIQRLTYRELSQEEQAILDTAIKVYLVYLRIEEEKKSEEKKRNGSELLETPSKGFHEKGVDQKDKVRRKDDPRDDTMVDHHQKRSISQMQFLLKMLITQILIERVKKKEELLLQEKMTIHKYLIIKSFLNEEFKNEELLKSTLLTTMIFEDPISKLSALTTQKRPDLTQDKINNRRLH